MRFRSTSLFAFAAGLVITALAIPGCSMFDSEEGRAALVADANATKVNLEATRAKFDADLAKAESEAATARQQLAIAEEQRAAAQAANDALAAKAAEKAAAEASRSIADAQARSRDASDGAASTRAVLDKLNQAVDALNQAVKPDGSVDPGGAVAAAGALFPPAAPWLALGIPIAGWLIREYKASQNLKSIAKALDKASIEDTELSQRLDEKWSSIEGTLTPAAKAAFDRHSVT